MNGKEWSSVNMQDLPDELLLNCLARVSRLYYPTLSLVCKRIRSLLASTELYKTRILLNRTENCIYLCSKTRWFTLSKGPTRISNPWSCFTPSTRKSIGDLLVSIPAPQNFASPQIIFSSPRWIPTTIGSKIYMIGGYINHEPSSRVFVMDCVSNTWHEAPSMRVPRTYPHVCVLDGRIYVIERFFDDCDSSILIESFDLKTQIWEHVPNPGVEIRGRYVYKTLAFEGNLYLFGTKNVVYKPKENKWEALVEWNLLLATTPNSCLVGDVLYCYTDTSPGMLRWYDSKVGFWRALEGLEELPKLPKGYAGVRLVNHGGKIVIFWQENVPCGIGGFTKKKMIWCAEIAVERRNRHEIYGKVQWCDVVFTVPKSCRFKQFLVATL